MDLYSFSLVLGAAGLGVMALGGLGHVFSHGAARGVAARGHAHGQAGAHAHGHGAHASHGGSHAHTSHAHAVREQTSAQRDAFQGPVMQRVWLLLSPRVVFSLFVGFGATGLAARALSEGPRFLVAGVGALLLERLIVTPLWNFYMRFGSDPALSLEGCIDDEARAVTHFDERGQGLVAVELDGRVVQLLGTLRPEDREAGIRVRAGDTVWIDDVDGTRNRCTIRPFQV